VCVLFDGLSDLQAVPPSTDQVAEGKMVKRSEVVITSPATQA
jgi:hypothetical protein